MTAANVPVRRITKLATYICAGVLAVVTVLSGARTLLIELGVPHALWLQEVRTFDGSKHGIALLPPNTLSWLNIGTREPIVFFERYGDCRLRQSEAVGARDQERLKREQMACLAIVDEILQVSPATSTAWLERARLILGLHGPDERFYQSLRRSYSTGAHEGWIAARRLPVVIGFWDVAPQDLRNAATTDAITLIQSDKLVASLADTYVRYPQHQKVITEIVDHHADQVGKQRFVDALQRIIELRKVPSVSG